MLLSSSTRKGEIVRAFPYFVFWMMMTTLCWSNRVLSASGSRWLGFHQIAILSGRKRSKTEFSTLFISLVVGNPYYQEGIHIGKSRGNLFTYTFLTPPLSSSVVRERVPPVFPYGFCSSQRLYRSLERLYRWTLTLSRFDRAVVPLPPGGGTATLLNKG